MPRFALKIEYDGLPFVGWQRQPDQISVQGSIEAALSKLQPGTHRVVAAGRTDAGVHALQQVAHCDLNADWDPFRLSEAINYHLKPNPIAILACAQVAEDWHARFSALERRYEFRLLARRAPLTHEEGTMWRVNQRLNVAAMQDAANLLLGHHDFTTFRSTICQADSPMRTLDHLKITEFERPYGQFVTFDVRARSFLHNQVRSLVGTLERVGMGAWTPADVTKALAAKDRAACGPVCPPYGLYLAGVQYKADPFLIG